MKPRSITFQSSCRSRLWLAATLLLLGLFGTLPTAAAADYGDFADLTFQCPAIVTCPVACVASLLDCPSDHGCPVGKELCADGSCSDSECNSSLESPCQYDCAPVACARLVTGYDQCQAIFGEIYEMAEECRIEALESDMEFIPATNPWFIALYTWISAITVLVFGWCAYNQRISPVEGSRKDLRSDARVCKTTSADCIQTAYSINLLGRVIYLASVLTLVGFHVVLGILTLLYYQEQEAILNSFSNVFDSEEQVLIVFAIVWVVGFVWSALMRWPERLSTLFLRRCNFGTATHVTVFAPYIPEATEAREDRELGAMLHSFIQALQKVRRLISFCMRQLFSDTSHPENKIGELSCLPVLVDPNQGTRYFVFRLRRYNYDTTMDCFVPGIFEEADLTVEDLTCSASDGLSMHEVQLRRAAIGQNEITLQKPTIIHSLYEEFRKPFYLYQTFIIWTWFPLWLYSLAILYNVVRLVCGCILAVQQYRIELSLYRSRQTGAGRVEVLRNGTYRFVPDIDVVPGDVVVVRRGVVRMDMVLIKGDHVLVDGSVMTGQSTPIAKKQLEDADGNAPYDPDKQQHGISTIPAGCTVLETTSDNERDLAVVTNTGSFTIKGELLRETMWRRPRKLFFHEEISFVVYCLFLWGVVAFCIVWVLLGDQPIYGWFHGMYAIAAALPPLIPTVAAMSVGRSANRLSRRRIAVRSPIAMLSSAYVDTAFFDKTGTLTKQGLELVSTKAFGAHPGDLTIGMMVCHTLRISKTEGIVGNTVDRIMFESTEARLHQITQEETAVVDPAGSRYVVLKRSEFDAERMTQCVIVKEPKGQLSAFVKGSPEKIMSMCDDQTLSQELEAMIAERSQQGLYQLAVAKRALPENLDLDTLSRNDVEQNLSLVGLLNFKNEVREETQTVLAELQRGDVRTIMLTGDSLWTGVSIAYDSGLIHEDTRLFVGQELTDDNDVQWVDWDTQKAVTIDLLQDVDPKHLELAIDGGVWLSLLDKRPSLARELAQNIRIYGRCTPSTKGAIVRQFNRFGRTTLMCGDGENDSGALGEAHVGLGLGNAESKMVAPFTSVGEGGGLSSVVDILKEGRCALASSLASCKYMLMYGLLSMVLQIICSYLRIVFSEWNQLFVHGVWLLTMTFTLQLSKPSKSLAALRPPSSLLGKQHLPDFFGVLLINLLFVFASLCVLYQQDWFVCRKWVKIEDMSRVFALGDNYESSVLFLVFGYQLIGSAAVYNFGCFYRRAWYQNWVFVVFFVGWTAFLLFITLVPSNLSCIFRINCTDDGTDSLIPWQEARPIENVFNTTLFPVEFRLKLIALMLFNFAMICLWGHFY